MNHKMKSGFSIDFSMVRSPKRVLTPLKSASFEIRISSFVILPKSAFAMDNVDSCEFDTESTDTSECYHLVTLV
jgi:hypothetical protein